MGAGTTYLYSDLNFMNLGFVLESTSAKTLDQLVKERITGPLGMRDTFYNTNNLPSDQCGWPALFAADLMF